MKIELPGALTWLTVALTGACALVYFAIGLGLIYRQEPDGVQLWLFGFSAAVAFALGVALMLLRPGRVVWVLGAVFMVFVIVAYVVVAPRRDPSFEIWGISLKVAQAAILAALLGLIALDRRAQALRAE